MPPDRLTSAWSCQSAAKLGSQGGAMPPRFAAYMLDSEFIQTEITTLLAAHYYSAAAARFAISMSRVHAAGEVALHMTSTETFPLKK